MKQQCENMIKRNFVEQDDNFIIPHYHNMEAIMKLCNYTFRFDHVKIIIYGNQS